MDDDFTAFTTPLPDSMVPIGHLAAALNRSNATIRRWEREGTLPRLAGSGLQRRYPQSYVDGLVRIAREEGVDRPGNTPIEATGLPRRARELADRLDCVPDEPDPEPEPVVATPRVTYADAWTRKPNPLAGKRDAYGAAAPTVDLGGPVLGMADADASGRPPAEMRRQTKPGDTRARYPAGEMAPRPANDSSFNPDNVGQQRELRQWSWDRLRGSGEDDEPVRRRGPVSWIRRTGPARSEAGR